MSIPDPYPIQPVDHFDLEIHDLPGSKSLTNRALLLAALAEGESILHNVLFADDSRVMLEALKQLGFELTIDEPARKVTLKGAAGSIPADKADLHLGNAGTATRFLTAACCLGHGEYRIDGIARMRERPIGELVNPLREIGANIDCEFEEGYPPLLIHAQNLKGGAIDMPATLSSQFISALLQIGPCLENGLTINFKEDVISRPYVEMTIALMQQFGATVETDTNFRKIQVSPGGYAAQNKTIEPDASNASYFLAAAAVRPGSRCEIYHLDQSSLQGDARFARLLARMGAEVNYKNGSIEVIGVDQLKGIDVDLNSMPDMAQTLAIVALFAQGPTIMRDIGNLRVKETDRMEALRVELSKLGAQVRVDGDDLHVYPPMDGLKPADIDTYDDHRMAMSFAIAGLVSKGVQINDPTCVNKTFPEYFDYLGRVYDKGENNG